ncbi:MAG TPA: hypothetical protein DCL15_10520 [Chloroflexi bacterium]|nr:hypothetical protein [Chloroflexota bacterium]HHW87356.1 hypothetical protein [Chloroflexota bacterium]
MRVDVKALTHWVIYKGYRVRFTQRSIATVAGVLTTAGGAELAFTYDPATKTVRLPGESIRINDFGWEVEHIRDENHARQ